MSMLMQIGQNPEHDFTNPVGMLEDCHKRILHFLTTLCTLADAAGRDPLTKPEHESLDRALRYFRDMAPRHTADEEESVFPRMRASGNEEAQAVLDKIASLEADHRWADKQHAEVDVVGRRWLEAGVLTLSDRARINSILHPLMRFYEHHLQIEEQEVFPAARAALSAVDTKEIGREMAERRGLTAS